ncbi:MAG: hypothetical protein GC159_07275 [Phycisphaera sp.]|nr:hypothetical protein [Phycisphaera sp.]
MRRCAFLTLEDPTGFFIYDQLAFEPLRDLGWDTVQIPWTRRDARWGDYDAVVIRSTWDYQNDPRAFLDTLATIEASGATLLNPRSTCTWNMEKTYLRDLAEKGVPIIPSSWPQRLDRGQLEAAFTELAATAIVVKPIIGANADDTFVLHRDDVDGWADALRVFADKPAIVQPFIESIRDTGEYSLFYFGGAYSHAVLKTPKRGDFRVQEEHGGQIQTTHPPDALLRVGQSAIDAIDDTLLYARVDLVIMPDGSPALIEIELIEPSLYFNYDAASPVRFAEALHRMMSVGG